MSCSFVAIVECRDRPAVTAYTDEDTEAIAMTPAERSLRARMAAYRMHASHDPKETTAAARAAFLARFEREVDPDGRLAPSERRRRAEAARKAYFTKLAIQSVRGRQRARRGGAQSG